MPESQAAKASLASIQADIGEWSKRNFGVTTILGDLRGLLLLMQHVGTLAHSMLKHSQGIRGTSQEHLDALAHAMPSFRGALSKFAYWSKQPNTDMPWDAAPLLGAIEEISEMLEALFDPALTPEVRQAKIRDGYADLFVFLLDFAGRNAIDAEASLNQTWETVRKRNWKKDKVSGGESA